MRYLSSAAALISVSSLFISRVAGSTVLTPRAVRCPNSTQLASNSKCCVWYEALKVVQDELFSGGECDEVAHDALRLSFHDAIGWSPTRGGGGADGSLIKFSSTELGYAANVGLDETVHAMKPLADKLKVSYGDFIQFASAVSVRNCQGGPRLEFFAGRPDAKAAAPDGLIPDAADSVTKILARMADAGFSPDELVDLLASHSIGFQEHVDKSIEFTPFDPTVEIFDGQFFLDTLLKGTIDMGEPGLNSGEALSPRPGEFRLQSDKAIARDPRTACRWARYITDIRGMQTNFKKAMAKLAVVGHKKTTLTDCSEVIPPPKNLNVPFPRLPPGKTLLDLEWSCSLFNRFRDDEVSTTSGPVEAIPRAFGH